MAKPWFWLQDEEAERAGYVVILELRELKTWAELRPSELINMENKSTKQESQVKIYDLVSNKRIQ